MSTLRLVGRVDCRRAICRHARQMLRCAVSAAGVGSGPPDLPQLDASAAALGASARLGSAPPEPPRVARSGTVGLIPPKDVAAANALIDAFGNPLLPRLRSVAPIAHSLRSVTPRLVLSADEQALLYFVYNGTPVDSRRLPDDQALVRVMSADSLHEIPRDRVAEKLFRSQLPAIARWPGRMARLHDEQRASAAGAGLGRCG